MTTQESDLTAIREQLEKLEKQNRRMKRAGLTIGVAALALVLTAQARPFRTVTANEFILRDEAGHDRAKLWMSALGPMLSLSDASGNVVAGLAGGGGIVGGGILELQAPLAPATRFLAVASPVGASVELDGPHFVGSKSALPTGGKAIDVVPQSATMLLLTDSAITLKGEAGDASLRVSGGPSLSLTDAAHFSATLGTTNLVTSSTGETHRTSAASMTLLDDKGHVIWETPSH